MINANAIPPELKLLSQWVLWKSEQRGGKATKVPYSINGQRAKVSEAATWTSFDEVLEVYQSAPGQWAGIGFVFATDGDLFGIDLDAAYDPTTRTLQPWAADVLRLVPSYAELSPSGFGLKITARGRPPIGDGRTGEVFKREHVDIDPVAGCDKEPEIAIYHERRFWTFTGQVFDGHRTIADGSDGAVQLFERLRSKRNNKHRGNGSPEQQAPMSDGKQVGNALAAMLRMDMHDNGDGSNRLYAAACRAVEADLEPADAIQAIREYERLKPFPSSWSDEEIQQRLSDAAKRTAKKEPVSGSKRSQASTAIELAESIELWHTPDGDGYASIPVRDHTEHVPVRSRAFRRWLAQCFYEVHDAAINSQSLADAICVLEARAVFKGDEHDVFVRLAGTQERVYLDLGNESRDVVIIDASGWHIAADPPLRFRRPRAMLGLPMPARGGDIRELRNFLNVDDEEWPLIVGWLVAAMFPAGPYPILQFNAEQGSGKSTAARILCSLVDPNSAPLRAEPKEPRDLMITAGNSWIVCLDNLSRVQGWLSDALCRLSTGGGFSTRALYENVEETIFDSQRPAIVTGIEELAARSDLLDRCLLVGLPPIPDERRRTESEFWGEFKAAQPQLLGGLLDVIAATVKVLPTVRLDRSPRMADFARVATAAETAAGLARGAFLPAYEANRAEANSLALESSPTSKAIVAALDDCGGTWEGTATNLLTEIDRHTSESARRQKSHPKMPRAMSGLLRRLAPNLRRVGIEVEFIRDVTPRRNRLIRLTRVGTEFCVQNVQNVRSEESPRENEPSTGRSPDVLDANRTMPRTQTSLELAGPDGSDGSDANAGNVPSQYGCDDDEGVRI